MEHPYFGTLDPSRYVLWCGTAESNGRPVAIDMSSGVAPSAAQLDAMAAIARDIGRLDAVARQQLQPTDETVSLYVEHHLAELSNEDLTAALGTSNKSQLTKAEFIRHLVLERVGLYPDSSTAVFDYSLHGNVTQYVLAVTFGKDGSVHHIEMES